MALNGDGFGLLWSEPLKVTVEGESRRGEAVLSPIGPSAKRNKCEDEKVSMLEKRIAALEEENRTLRAALAALRDIGNSVLRALAGNPQEAAQAAHDSRPTPEVDAGSVSAASTKADAEATFSFTIRKADNTDLGLDVSSGANQRGLLVEAILPGGAAEAWNKQQDPGRGSRELCPGDTILQVNSAQGPEEMLMECRHKMLLKLTVQRAKKLPQVPESPPPEKVVSYSPSLRSMSTEDSSKNATPIMSWSSPLWLPTPSCFDSSTPMGRRLLAI